jgi:hypothetical protein
LLIELKNNIITYTSKDIKKEANSHRLILFLFCF